MNKDKINLNEAIAQSCMRREIITCPRCKSKSSCQVNELVGDHLFNLLSTCQACGKQRKFKINLDVESK